MFKRAWRNTSAFFGEPVGLILSGAISVAIAIFVLPIDPWGLIVRTGGVANALAVYLIFLMLLAIGIVQMANMVSFARDKVRLEWIAELSKLHLQGTKLIGGIAEHGNREEFTPQKLLSILDEWMKQVLVVFRQESIVRANRWESANSYQTGGMGQFDVFDDEVKNKLYYYFMLIGKLGENIDQMREEIELRNGR